MKILDWRELVDRATQAASNAAAKMIHENPTQWYPCGFAWVTIKPARGPLVSYLKSQGIGNRGTYGGWVIWNPSGNLTQWMDAKMAGAEAFAEVLREYKIDAEAESRMD